MPIQMNVAEAKARLSELIAAAERGEEVVIARAGQPAVRLVATAPTGRRRPGILRQMGWTCDAPYELFEPDPQDAIESRLFPDDPDS
jgi:prevent-host-death family protein